MSFKDSIEKSEVDAQKKKRVKLLTLPKDLMGKGERYGTFGDTPWPSFYIGDHPDQVGRRPSKEEKLRWLEMCNEGSICLKKEEKQEEREKERKEDQVGPSMLEINAWKEKLHKELKEKTCQQKEGLMCVLDQPSAPASATPTSAAPASAPSSSGPASELNNYRLNGTDCTMNFIE